MTIAELDLRTIGRNWGESRRRRPEHSLQGFTVSFCDRVLCFKWAEVICNAKDNGRPIKIADARIAATALLYGMPLVTHNRSNYMGVDGVTVISEAP